MIDLLKLRLRRKFVARCGAEASEASRSVAAGNELRASWASAGLPQLEQNHWPTLRLSPTASRTQSSRIQVPQLANEQTSKVDRPFASALGFESHWITD